MGMHLLIQGENGKTRPWISHGTTPVHPRSA